MEPPSQPYPLKDKFPSHSELEHDMAITFCAVYYSFYTLINPDGTESVIIMTQPGQELKNLLTNFALSNNMSLSQISQLIDMIMNREEILSRHKAPISQNERDKRWRTRLPNGKQVVKTNHEDLLDALVDYYSTLPQEPHNPVPQAPMPQQKIQPSTGSRTLKSIYPEWLSLRKAEVSRNTLAKDIKNWDKYIAVSNISDTPLNQLNKALLKLWASQLVTGYSMKKKYFNNIKTVLNSMLEYASDNGYIESNCLKDIKLNSRLFQAASIKEENEEVFTIQEQELIMKEAELDSQNNSSALPLGICILFLTGMRVGELCGLQYGDIRGDYLYIQRMLVEKQAETLTGLKHGGYEIVPHTKTKAGQRRIYLTPKARDYFKQVRELNRLGGFPDSDTSPIFQRAEGLCNQRVFDSRLKKYCNPNHLNLPFAKSCHDIRRTYISMLFDNGMNPDEIRRLVGHENIEMTMQYCRGRHSQEELAHILEQIEATRGVTRCNTKNVTLSREKQKGNGGNAHFSRLPATHKHNVHKRTRHVR